MWDGTQRDVPHPQQGKSGCELRMALATFELCSPPWPGLRGQRWGCVCCGFKALPGCSVFPRLEHQAVILCSTGLAALAALCLITLGCCWDACPASSRLLAAGQSPTCHHGSSARLSCAQSCQVLQEAAHGQEANWHLHLPGATPQVRDLPSPRGSLLYLAQQWDLFTFMQIVCVRLENAVCFD